LTFFTWHETPTHFSYSKEKSKWVECHQKEIALQKWPGAHAVKVSKPAASAGALGCPVTLLAAGPSKSSSGEEWWSHLHGEQFRFK